MRILPTSVSLHTRASSSTQFAGLLLVVYYMDFINVRGHLMLKVLLNPLRVLSIYIQFPKEMIHSTNIY